MTDPTSSSSQGLGLFRRLFGGSQPVLTGIDGNLPTETTAPPGSPPVGPRPAGELPKRRLPRRVGFAETDQGAVTGFITAPNPVEKPVKAPEPLLGTPSNPAGASAGTPSRLREVAVERSKFSMDRALTNPLDDYIDVTYNFSFAIVRESKVREIQERALSGTPLNSILGVDDVFIFASTGDVETNTPEGINFFTIRSVEFTNLMAATVENPILTPMFDIKMTIFEPHGFRFNEHIRTLGRMFGYGSVQPGRYVYRLQLWFSGYDPRTGAWTKKIKLNQIDGKDVDTITQFVSIPNIEATITPAGTEYAVTCVPRESFAYRAADYTLEATTITTGPGRNFGGLLTSLAQQLERQKRERSHDRLKHEYEFICPQYLADAVYTVGPRSSFLQKRSANPESDLYHTVGESIGILMFIRKALDNLELVQRQMVQGSANKAFLTPTIRYSIRVNAVFLEISDPAVGDYTKIRFQYVIEPHISFYRGVFRIEDRDDLVKLDNQIKRADKMIGLGMLHKVYDFLFSSGNSEVLNFQFKFNRFFGESLDPIYDNLSMRAQGTGETPNESSASMAREDAVPVIRVDPSDTGESSQARVTRILGSPSQVRTGTDTFSSTDILGGHSEVHPRQTPNNGNFSEAEQIRRHYEQASDLFTRYEMLKADIDVRGDPVWMFNPYMAEGDFTANLSGGVFSTKGTANFSLKAQTDRYLFLKAYSPAQNDLMNPYRQYGSSEPTLIGGFYLVVKSHSKFQDGKYTQTLECSKVVHLNYLIDSIKLINSTTTQQT